MSHIFRTTAEYNAHLPCEGCDWMLDDETRMAKERADDVRQAAFRAEHAANAKVLSKLTDTIDCLTPAQRRVMLYICRRMLNSKRSPGWWRNVVRLVTIREDAS